MRSLTLTRRAALLGAGASLSGCSAVSSINAAATPLDTYDLSAPTGPDAGPRSGRTLLVAVPDAPAAVAGDRIMVRPGGAAITYLPEARWSDELPALLQSLLVRSIAATGRVGYVGQSGAGPVPDQALLSRIDAFGVEIVGDAAVARVDLSLTLVRDRDQSILRSAVFRDEAPATDTSPTAIVAAFQQILDTLLPEMARWAVSG